eukprot:evm.model.NODE_1553_length_1414_cov_36.574966.1
MGPRQFLDQLDERESRRVALGNLEWRGHVKRGNAGGREGLEGGGKEGQRRRQ